MDVDGNVYSLFFPGDKRDEGVPRPGTGIFDAVAPQVMRIAVVSTTGPTIREETKRDSAHGIIGPRTARCGEAL